MKTFLELQEDHAGKNLHLEHLEDEIINNGVAGGRAAINFLQSLRDMLSGSARSSVNMTVKWDVRLRYSLELTQVMVSFLLQRSQCSMSTPNSIKQMQR